MVATLDDASAVHHHDPVGIANGGKAVGDDEGGAPSHQFVHPLLHHALGACIDAAGGFVEDECRRIGHGGAGNGDELPLALTQVAAVGGERGVVTLCQTTDEVVGMHELGGGDALLVGGFQPAIAYVLHDRCREEMRLLEHDAERLAQLVALNVANVDAVVENAAALNVVEPVDEVGDGGLARSRSSHEGNLLSGVGIHFYVEQHLRAECLFAFLVDDGIGEVHAKEVYFSPLTNQWLSF